MRQDYIRTMADPQLRREYIDADAADDWAPKSTRCFAHSEEVTGAWKALNEAVRAGNQHIYPGTADGVISDHINRALPVLDTPESKYIEVNECEVGFGPDWTADEVADMVQRDILPDSQLTAMLDSVRHSAVTLTVLQASAEVAHQQELETEAELIVDSYDGPYVDYEDEDRSPVALSFPSHPGAALQGGTPAPPARPDGASTHHIRTNIER